MLMKTGILYFTTCFHGFGILRHVDPFVRMLHIYRTIIKNSLHNRNTTLGENVSYFMHKYNIEILDTPLKAAHYSDLEFISVQVQHHNSI